MLLVGRRLLRSASRSLPPPVGRFSPIAAAALAAAARDLAAAAKGGKGDADKYAAAPESMGAFKSPIVEALWGRRGTARELEGENPSPPIYKKPGESQQSITYSFSSDEYLTQAYQNPWGFFRKGKLFEDLDALAGTIAFAHSERDGKVPLLVTASVDRIRLQNNPQLDEDMEMSGAVVWSGSSSMVIDMQVRLVSDPRPWITASFTFVARSPQTGKAAKINRLVPETPDEEARFNEIEVRNAKRKQKRLAAGAATAGGKSGALQTNNGGIQNKGAQFNKQAMVGLLLSQGRALLEMPCLADPTCVLIDHTKLSNSTVMQPQQRNMLSRIFGGFLMRRAYELAFSCCYLFGGTRPSFYEVAEVNFLSPVDVGDLMRFDSCVLYTHIGDDGLPHVHVQVVANICRPEKQTSTPSNIFNFVFKLCEKATVLKVLPSNRDQAERMVQRIEAVLSRD